MFRIIVEFQEFVRTFHLVSCYTFSFPFTKAISFSLLSIIIGTLLLPSFKIRPLSPVLFLNHLKTKIESDIAKTNPCLFLRDVFQNHLTECLPVPVVFFSLFQSVCPCLTKYNFIICHLFPKILFCKNKFCISISHFSSISVCQMLYWYYCIDAYSNVPIQ